ncbi:MAG: J domain-containing protein [Elainellaceae cyanobacterium]
MRFDIKLGNGYANVPRPPIGEIVAQINARTQRSGHTKVVLGSTPLLSLIVFAIAPIWVAGIILIAGVSTWLLMERDRQQHQVTTLNYSLDTDMKTRFAAVQRACRILANSEKIWLEETRQMVQDRHKNAGASHSVNFDASPVRVVCSAPPLIATNLTIWSIHIGDVALFFFPDYILLWRRKLYTAISYSALTIRFERERINLRGSVPKDASLTGQTWQHLRNDGSPDPRLNANSKLVQVEYGLLTLLASIGISMKLHVSNVLVAEQFAELFQSVQEWLSPRAADDPISSTHSSPVPQPTHRFKPAHEVLGIQPDATLSEIRAAYHGLARMNHPDKVVGLAPEFRILAERRMKMITAAYKALSEQARVRG